MLDERALEILYQVGLAISLPILLVAICWGLYVEVRDKIRWFRAGCPINKWWRRQ
jgi:hypothetical protein